MLLRATAGTLPSLAQCTTSKVTYTVNLTTDLRSRKKKWVILLKLKDETYRHMKISIKALTAVLSSYK